MQRRQFLQTSGYLAVGSMLATRPGGCNRPEELDAIGLQLYTIRDAMQRSPDDTLRRVAEIGYNYVEGAGYSLSAVYGKSAKAFKATLDEYGLTMPSGHVSLDIMKENPKKAAAEAKMMGQSFVVIPWIAEDMRNIRGYEELADVLNTAGEVCKTYGLQMAYHNHDFEFNTMIAAQKPYDYLLENTEADLVKFELDLYWITRAGSDYQKYFAKHSGRFPLWHVKDMDNTPDKFFAAVGDGVIDWPSIFDAQEKAGMQHFFVEQDRTRPGKFPLEEIVVSYNYLDKLQY